ncbi:MAG: hypothetical protein EOP86_28015 [Verrucomicrobiaceae bacterium]|nr:MAG: hypothetical protein EOP86_28015 [Verrucomicrobiaceae bacterium]
MTAVNFVLAWSFGSFLTWILSLYFRETYPPPELFAHLFRLPIVGDSDDLAGLICYMLTALVFAALTGLKAWRDWKSWRLPWPCWRPLLAATALSAIVTAPLWALFGWFFEKHRFKLPGDGNWPAIGCLLSVLALFLWLIPDLHSGGGDQKRS